MMRWVLAIVLLSGPAWADVEDVDTSGWTALMRAAESGNTAEITALLDRGADLEAHDARVYQNATPLVIALEFDQHDAAKLLLDRGASVAGATGTAALELTARSGYDDLVGRLLAAKVSPLGTGALRLAARFGRVSTIKKLVKAGMAVRDADKTDHGVTALVVACQNDQVEAARTLLALGANANDVDADGKPALHWAVFGERPDEIHLYRDLGKPHDTVFRAHRTAPLVSLLVAAGAKLDAVDADGNTALHEAALMEAASAAKVLLAAGANPRVKNRDGKTAYELAKAHDNAVEPVLRDHR